MSERATELLFLLKINRIVPLHDPVAWSTLHVQEDGYL
jgi:hypothetical protein